jgi:hypothetical protein
MVKFLLPRSTIRLAVTDAVTMHNRDKGIQRRSRATAIKVLIEIDLV